MKNEAETLICCCCCIFALLYLYDAVDAIYPVRYIEHCDNLNRDAINAANWFQSIGYMIRE